MNIIYVKNQTKCNDKLLINDEQGQDLVNGCHLLLIEMTKLWGLHCPRLIYCQDNNPVTDENQWIFYLINHKEDLMNALPNQTIQDNIGYIPVATILDNGGYIFNFKDQISSTENMIYSSIEQDKLDLKNKHCLTVASALFHEIAETLIDKRSNLFWSTNQNNLIAAEVCNPVQDINVWIHYGQYDMALCDFILPSWKNYTSAPFDYRHKLSTPFSISRGGHAILYDLSDKQNIFGDLVPNWLADWRKEDLRSKKRLTKLPSILPNDIDINKIKRVPKNNELKSIDEIKEKLKFTKSDNSAIETKSTKLDMIKNEIKSSKSDLINNEVKPTKLDMIKNEIKSSKSDLINNEVKPTKSEPITNESKSNKSDITVNENKSKNENKHRIKDTHPLLHKSDQPPVEETHKPKIIKERKPKIDIDDMIINKTQKNKKDKKDKSRKNKKNNKNDKEGMKDELEMLKNQLEQMVKVDTINQNQKKKSRNRDIKKFDI